MSRFRVVADTNVYVSALHFGGVADEIVALGRTGRLQLFLSPPILAEIEGVLVRKFGWSTTRARDALGLIQAFADVVRPTTTVAVVREDEPDNRILECALAARAQVIVSGDGHLRSLGTFQGIPILSLREFFDVYPTLARHA